MRFQFSGTDNFFNNSASKIDLSIWNKTKLDSCFILHTEINSGWIKALYAKSKTIKILEENSEDLNSLRKPRMDKGKNWHVNVKFCMANSTINKSERQ